MIDGDRNYIEGRFIPPLPERTQDLIDLKLYEVFVRLGEALMALDDPVDQRLLTALGHLRRAMRLLQLAGCEPGEAAPPDMIDAMADDDEPSAYSLGDLVLQELRRHASGLPEEPESPF